jgi:sulfonate transport system ATP-binding protein
MKGRKMAGQPKISVKNLTKKFDDLTVLNDISFDINKGDFVCIVGPTGCGKTTFLNLLVKLIEPTSGEILIDGEPADPKKHNISFVFQEPSNFPWLTVEDNIKFNLKLKGIDKKEIQNRTDKILDLIGLADKKDVYPRELSVSAEQRVVIGRSFAVYPDLLLMDEPYGQMDIKVRYYLEDEVLKLWKETGSTVLFITHNIEEAIYLSQKCLIMSQKPTTVKAIIENPLPYPRNVSDPEFIKLREEVTDMIKWW